MPEPISYTLVFAEKPRLAWKLEPDPAATVEQRGRLEDWLRGPEPEAAAAAALSAQEELAESSHL